jgi:hypothetical protein
MEKILNGGLVIRDTRTETRATTQKLPLEAPNNKQSTTESTGSSRIGQAPKIKDKLSRGDFLLGKLACVSVGVQTDPVAYDAPTSVRTPRQSVFSIGGPSSRKDSVVSYPDSGIENGSLDIETRNGELIQTAEPRPVSECVNIYKSDVSCPLLSTIVHMHM